MDMNCPECNRRVRAESFHSIWPCVPLFMLLQFHVREFACRLRFLHSDAQQKVFGRIGTIDARRQVLHRHVKGVGTAGELTEQSRAF
jgi:hypothetical protein